MLIHNDDTDAKLATLSKQAVHHTFLRSLFAAVEHMVRFFYDYDEVQYLLDMNFRKIPEAMTPEQEMASEPWYHVGTNDVFPEEFIIGTNSSFGPSPHSPGGNGSRIDCWDSSRCR